MTGQHTGQIGRTPASPQQPLRFGLRPTAEGRMLVFKVLLAAVFAVGVIFPLLRMLYLMVEPGGFTDIAKLMSSPKFLQALGNSLTTATLATGISLVLAFSLAWCVTRTGIHFKSIISIFLTLPMLIPSLSHGMGLILLFGNNGLLSGLPFVDGGFIYGFAGIVIGEVLYSFPVAFLMLVNVLQYEDSTPYEAAAVLGISKRRRLTAVTLPYLRRPLISVIFATFTLVVTDYGVALYVSDERFTILPMLMYEKVVGNATNWTHAAFIGLCLLVPAVAAFLIDLFNCDPGNTSFVTRPFRPGKRRLRDGAAYVLCGLVCLCVAAPIVAFGAKAFFADGGFTLEPITTTFANRGGEYLLNSLLISLMAALIGVTLAVVTAYCTARSQGKMSRLLHLLSITSLAIPGLVLGLSYMLVFRGEWLYGTMAILVMVNIAHFFSSPYLMLYNAFGKLNGNLEAVGETLGIGRTRMLLRVFLPRTFGTLLEVFSYFFVNGMMTISAVSFLANTANKPLSLLLNQFEGQANRLGAAAFVSLMILGVNLLMKGIVYVIKRWDEIHG